ncbi:hypothetical protein BSKO_03419 [Bryopsis sp. KO-2023]|nr:hypothetical protein BSKO_03419 [Bryopsis sp. KO-2023]
MACLRYTSVQLLRKCYGAYEMVLLKQLSSVLGWTSPCAVPDGCSTSYSDCGVFQQARDLSTSQQQQQHRVPWPSLGNQISNSNSASSSQNPKRSGRKRSRLSTMAGDDQSGGSPRKQEPRDDRFYKLKEWEDVEKKIKQLDKGLTVEHLAAAFNVLKRLKRRPPDPFLDSLTEKALVLLPKMHSWNFCAILHAFAKLEYVNSRFLDAMTEEILKPPKLIKFKPIQMACCIYSTGVLFLARNDRFQRKGRTMAGEMTHVPFKYHKLLLDSLAGCLIHSGVESSLTPRMIAGMFYGLALSKRRHGPLLNLLASEVARKERLESCTEQEFSTIVYSIGLLRFRHPILLHSLGDFLSKPEKLRHFSAQGLSNTLYGIAISGANIPLTVLRAMVWEACRPHRLKSFLTQHLCNIIYSLGTLRVKNPKVYSTFFQEIADLERAARDGMTLEGYVAIMSGIGRANVMVAEVEKVGKILTSGKNPRKLSNQGLSNTILNIGKMIGQFDFEMPSEMLEEVCSPGRLSSYTEQNLASIMYGLVVAGMFRDLDRELLDRLVEEACSAKRVPAYTHQGLANVIFSVGRMKVDKLEYHDRFGEEVVGRLSDFAHNGLAMIIYAWGNLEYRNGKVISMCLEEVTKEARLRGFTEQGLSNVLFGLIRMGCREKEPLRTLMGEIKRRVLPKFKYQTPPELILEVLKAKVMDEETEQMLVRMLKVIIVRFKSEEKSVENLPAWAGGGGGGRASG